MEWIVFLAVGTVTGLLIGLALGAVRAARRHRPRELAVDAELQAARQRAERATGEAQALRTRLMAAEVLAGRASALEADLAAARADAERNATLANRLESEIAALRLERRTRDEAVRPRIDPSAASVKAPFAQSDEALTGSWDVTPTAVRRPTRRQRTEVELTQEAVREPGSFAALPLPLEPTPQLAAPVADVPVHSAPASVASVPWDALAAPKEPDGAVESTANDVPTATVEATHEVGSREVSERTAASDGPPPVVAAAPASDEPVVQGISDGSPREIAGSGGGSHAPDLELHSAVAQPQPLAVAPPDEVLPQAAEVGSHAVGSGSPAFRPSAVVADDTAVADPGPHPSQAASHTGPDEWMPIRIGLSDPRDWLGTTSPSGVRYGEDDLQRIHGIGPYLAGRLRAEGILTWRQIAEWDDDDMTLVSRRIGSFPDRIRREDWASQARTLHADVYGEQLP